jgi:hypothetical protein
MELEGIQKVPATCKKDYLSARKNTSGISISSASSGVIVVSSGAGET